MTTRPSVVSEFLHQHRSRRAARPRADGINYLPAATTKEELGMTTPVRQTRIFKSRTRIRREPVPIDLRTPAGRLLPF